MSTDQARPGFVAIEQVRYRYGSDGPAIVQDVDWVIPRGEIHCLLGRSGCGKTTLLKLAAGLLSPGEGAIRIGGEALHGPSPRAGFVFQAPTLLDWLSALDNVLLPVSLKRRPIAVDRDAARGLLARIGLDPHHAADAADFEPVGAVGSGHHGLCQRGRHRTCQQGQDGQPGTETSVQAQKRHPRSVAARHLCDHRMPAARPNIGRSFLRRHP